MGTTVLDTQNCPRGIFPNVLIQWALLTFPLILLVSFAIKKSENIIV